MQYFFVKFYLLNLLAVLYNITTAQSRRLYAHGAILAALLQRKDTGRGQHIDCNLLSTQVIS